MMKENGPNIFRDADMFRRLNSTTVASTSRPDTHGIFYQTQMLYIFNKITKRKYIGISWMEYSIEYR